MTSDKIESHRELRDRINSILEDETEEDLKDTIKSRIMTNPKTGEKHPRFVVDPVDGEAVSEPLGYGEGANEEKEFEEIRDQVASEMENEEIGVENDVLGRPVLAEADGDDSDGSSDDTSADDDGEGEGGSEPSFGLGDGEGSSDDGSSGSDDGKGDRSAAEEENADVEKAREKNEEGKGDRELKDGETTTIQNFDEFFKRTDTKITVKLEGKEPSPIFGPNDTSDHNRYKVTITNNKGGSISWTYWDSIANTEKNEVPDNTEIMKDFGENLELAVVGKSFQEFKSECGYEDSEDSIAQKQYNNLRKLKDSIRKIYPDQHQVYELIQVAKKV